MSRRALLLVNRHARRGAVTLEQARPLLEAGGIQLCVESLTRSGDVASLVRAHKEFVDLVIVVGGDGTLNGVVDSLLELNIPCGIVPAGTANDLARTLGVPVDVAAACAVILAGHSRTIDLGWVNGRHYFNVAGIGLSARITQQLSKESKSRWGVLAYLLTAARVVIGSRPFRASLLVGGETHHVWTVQIIVGNGRHYGGSLQVAEDAEIDDERLDLISLEIDAWWQILTLLPAMRSGTLRDSPHVRTLRGKEFQITTDRPRRVNADGELATQTPARFRVISHALRVFAPPPSRQADP